MPGSNAPATLVICASLPKSARFNAAGQRGLLRGPEIPITWLAPWDGLAVAADMARSQAGCDVALEVPAAAFESRQRLRTLLARARDVIPGLAAIAVRGPAAPEHRSLLVEEGVGVALVESLGSSDRGSRRPAPRGWRCRNSAWGLWEVELTPPPSRGPLAWLGLAGMPRPRQRSLHALRTEGLAAGNAGSTFLAARLQRWLAWARRHVDRGRAEAVTLPCLAARLAGEEQGVAQRSVLRAA